MQLQYIGARYAPIWYQNSLNDSADWESNVEYEPLTFVTLPNNHLYLSKKTVPETVGTPASNIEYWLDMGAYSGSYADLSEKIGDINELLTPDTDNLVNAINSFYKIFDGLTHQDHVAIFGDSWVDLTHDPSNVYIPQMIRDQFNVTVDNYSYGGTRFDDLNGYDEQITWFAADNIDPNKIKFVLLCAGVNEYGDGTSAEDFQAKLTDWYDKLLAVLGKEVPVYWIASYSIANTYGGTNPQNYFAQYNYYDAIRISIKRPIIGINIMGLVSTWRNTTHPNQNGQFTLSKNIVNIINGVEPEAQIYQTLNGTIEDNNIPAVFRGVTMRFFIQDNALDCEFQYAMGALGVVANDSLITFDANFPAKMINNLYLDEGCIVSPVSDNQLKITVINPGCRTWTTSMSGYQKKTFKILQ